jgi:hypothetical protein
VHAWARRTRNKSLFASFSSEKKILFFFVKKTKKLLLQALPAEEKEAKRFLFPAGTGKDVKNDPELVLTEEVATPMGMEAECTCRWDAGRGQVKALLESHALIIRGALRRTIPLAAITQIAAEDDALHVIAGAESISLDLGGATAQRWARKIAAPPPSLAKKLGVGIGSPAYVIGDITDDALRAALNGASTQDRDAARISLAMVRSETELLDALTRHPRARPIWIVYGKGAKTAFGEAAVRRVMRAAGFMDNKVSAVSETWSATRYAVA